MGRVVAAAVYSAGRKVTNISLDEGADWAKKPGHFVWIGLEEPNAQELANLQRQFNLHELAIEDALEKHSRPKLETFGDALFIVTYSPVRHEGKLEFIETHIFAGNGYIITCRNGHSKSYALVRQRCEARPLLLEHGEDFVLYALLDFVTENYQPVSEAIHGEIEELEQNVLSGSLQEADIRRIHGLRRDILRLRRYVAPMVEVSEELQRLTFPFIDKNMRPYFRDVQIHVTRQMEDLAGIRDILLISTPEDTPRFAQLLGDAHRHLFTGQHLTSLRRAGCAVQYVFRIARRSAGRHRSPGCGWRRAAVRPAVQSLPPPPP